MTGGTTFESGGRALVTGVAGFLGSRLAERLVAAGHEVVGIDCFTGMRAVKEANLAGLRGSPRFRLLELDLSRDPIREVVAGARLIYHLAAQTGVRGSFGAGFAAYRRNNIHATQRLLEAALGSGVKALVYASSSSVYGDADADPTPETAARRPVSPYGLTKCAVEDLAAAYHLGHGLPVVGLRYFTLYGPRQRPDMAFARFIAAALSGRPLGILGDGLQERDFTFVEDAVEGTLLAAAHGRPGSVYNIGGGARTSLRAVISILETLVDAPLSVVHRARARGDARRTCADPARARTELGFQARVPLADGLARQLDWTLGSGLSQLAARTSSARHAASCSDCSSKPLRRPSSSDARAR
jgi:nucleoside-diphosphate-sugar epimerase